MAARSYKKREIIMGSKGRNRKVEGGISVREAGRRGGERVRDEYGPEFYSDIGRKGGERTAETHGREFYEDIGRKGGEAVKERYGPSFYREIGKRGGEARGREIREERGMREEDYEY